MEIREFKPTVTMSEREIREACIKWLHDKGLKVIPWHVQISYYPNRFGYDGYPNAYELVAKLEVAPSTSGS